MENSIKYLPRKIKESLDALAEDSCEKQITILLFYINELCLKGGDYIPEFHNLISNLCKAMITLQIKPQFGYIVLLQSLMLRPKIGSLVLDIFQSSNMNAGNRKMKKQMKRNNDDPESDDEDEDEKGVDDETSSKVFGMIFGYFALLRSCCFEDSHESLQLTLDSLFQLRCFSVNTLNVVGNFLLNFLSPRLRTVEMEKKGFNLCNRFDELLIEETNEEKLAIFFKNDILSDLDLESHDSIHFMFTVAHLILPYMKQPKYISEILSEQVIQCLMNAKNVDDSGVLSGAEALMTTILDIFAKHEKDSDSTVQLTIIEQFITHPGTLHFDRLSNTQLLAQSQNHYSSQTTKILAAQLKKIYEKEYVATRKQLLKCNDISQINTMELNQSLIWISSLVNLRVMQPHRQWKISVSKFLFEKIFFVRHIKSFDSKKLKQLFPRFLHPSKILGEQSAIIEAIEEEVYSLFQSKYVKQQRISSTAVMKWDEAHAKITELKVNEPSSLKDTVTKVLLCYLSLSLVIDETLAVRLIKVLIISHDYKGDTPAKTLEYWIRSILRVLIELLNADTAMWRQVTKAIFRNISDMISLSSIKELVEIVVDSEALEEIGAQMKEERDAALRELEEEDEEKQQQEGSDDEEEIKEESDDEEIKEESDDEEEIKEESDDDEEIKEESDDEKEIKKEELDDEEDTDNDSETEEEDESGDENESFEGIPVEINSDFNDVDLDDAPQEELDRLDKQIGSILAQKVKKHATKSTGLPIEIKKDLRHRIRVCDLLFMLAKYPTRLDQVLCIPVPLYTELEKITERDIKEEYALATKIRGLLASLSKSADAKNVAEADINLIADDIQQVLDFADNEHLNDVKVRILRNIVCFLVKCGLHVASAQNMDASNVIITTLNEGISRLLLDRNCKIECNIFLGAMALGNDHIFEIAYRIARLIFYFGKPKKNKDNIEEEEVDEFPEMKAVAHIYRKPAGFLLLKKIFENPQNVARMPAEKLLLLQEFLCTKFVKEFNHYNSPRQITINFMIPMLNFIRTLYKLHSRHPELSSGFEWDKVKDALIHFYEHTPLKPIGIVKREFNSVTAFLHIDLKRAQLKYTPEEEEELVVMFDKKRRERKFERMQDEQPGQRGRRGGNRGRRGRGRFNN